MLQSDRLRFPRLMWSMMRPGVPTRISIPLRMARAYVMQCNKRMDGNEWCVRSYRIIYNRIVWYGIVSGQVIKGYGMCQISSCVENAMTNRHK